MEDVRKLITSLVESSEEDTERLKRLQLDVDSVYKEVETRFASEMMTMKERIVNLEGDKEKADQQLGEAKEEFQKELEHNKSEKEAYIEKQHGEIQDFKSQLEKLAEVKQELEEKLRSVQQDMGKELEELKEAHNSKIHEDGATISELRVKCDHLENEALNLKAQNAGLKIKMQRIKNEEEVSSSSSSSDEAE